MDDTSTRSSSGYSAQRAGILADADALLMTASVNTLRPPAEIHTVVELVYTSSAALLLPSTVVRHKSAEDPDEAVTGREAGGTYSGGTRNPRNVEITQGRINRINMAKDGARLSWKKREIRTTVAREAGLAEWQASTFYSAGRVMLPSIMDTLAWCALVSVWKWRLQRPRTAPHPAAAEAPYPPCACPPSSLAACASTALPGL